MGTIPAPDIFHDASEIAQAPQNAMAEYARVAALNQQTQQSAAMAPLQRQQAQQQIQAQQRQFADQDALTKTITQYDPQKHTLADIPKLITQNGGSGQAALQAQQGLLAQKKNLLTLNDDQFAQQQKLSDLAQGVHDEVTSAKPEEKQAVYTQGLQRLGAAGMDVSKEPPQYPGDDVFSQHLAPIQLHSAIVADAAKQREADQNAAKARNENAQAAHQEFLNKLTENSKPGDFDKQVDGLVPPTGAEGQAQNQFVKAQVNAALSRGDVDGAKKFIEQAYQNQLGIQKDVAVATNPAMQNAKVAVAQRIKLAEQAITQGDPAAAGKLLADGSVTLSELKSRGTTPEFIVQATNAAQQINPNFNPQKAEADLSVAKSPASVAFFGSAKSLTDKGGTLDQLKEAAKDIPEGRIPVFNSIADVAEAATGSGPIAKYASILLGVSDDYSKVMGGGQGSDTSRTQALKLVPANASPQARDAAIEGIRGAVGSQINSRIGNNAVMKRMYGDQGGGNPLSLKAPNGKTYNFKTQQDLDNFKKEAGIQ